MSADKIHCHDKLTLNTRKETISHIAINAEFTRSHKWFRTCQNCFAKFLLTQQISKSCNLLMESGGVAATSSVVRSGETDSMLTNISC